MTTLFAQPYNIDATGFYFESAEDYAAKAKDNFDRYGQFVEEYEIQFIDGESIDAEVAKAWDLSQCNFAEFFDFIDEFDDEQKTRFIIAVGECGYALEQVASNPDSIDIDIYHLRDLKELAEEFVEEGLFGDIPENLRFYIDYNAIARDLSVDYATAEIVGKHLIYRCA
jgi:antirestriction protein